MSKVGRLLFPSSIATVSIGFGDPSVVRAIVESDEILPRRFVSDSRFNVSNGAPVFGTTESSYNCSISEVNLSVFLGRRTSGLTPIT